MHDHDLGYNKFFSHSRMVQDLVEGFIHADWVSGLDFSTLEKVNPVYVSDDFRKRINDLVWKIRQKFPPVAPIVLYNGPSRWTAALNVADLIEKYPPGLEACRPHMHYLLIDEHRFQESDLRSMQNVVAALFRLEKSRTLDNVRQVVQELDLWLKGPHLNELRRTFANWLVQILLPRLSKKNPVLPESIPEINDLKEVHVMLAETAVRWTKEWEQEGHKKGRKEERADILLRILRRHFSGLPSWVESGVRAADLDTLDIWMDRAIDARSLQDVFGDETVSDT
ncbi:MAG: Rpn family recombination-promoting nuclease/putative transposase [Magnetococcales bacterium]|nr:Rpn family recombination-promoting nuclease/putative transposase [Magnetococcales bacterium]